MAVDAARIEAVRAWLERAERDLAIGLRLSGDREPMLNEAAFHAQQAAEKAIKGFLSWHDLIFPKTHDLARLGALCAAVDPRLGELCAQAEYISEFVAVFRYPPNRDATRLEVAGALKAAGEIRDAVLARLPPEVRPVKSP